MRHQKSQSQKVNRSHAHVIHAIRPLGCHAGDFGLTLNQFLAASIDRLVHQVFQPRRSQGIGGELRHVLFGEGEWLRCRPE